MAIQFGFCIYGTDLKYYIGLQKNLDIIASLNFGPIKVTISYTVNTVVEYIDKFKQYPFVEMVFHSDTKYQMIGRIFAIDNMNDDDIFFSRDADSRITARDIWCITQFINSNKSLHVIRDHFYHRKRIMGGMFGIRKKNVSFKIKHLWDSVVRSDDNYGADENFLETNVYPLLAHDCLVHSNIVGYAGEEVYPILCEQDDDTDFVGNVYSADDIAEFGYKKYITPELIYASPVNHIRASLFSYLSIDHVEWQKRYDLLLCIYNAYIELNNVTNAMKILAQFRKALINEEIIRATSSTFELLRTKMKIIASFDPERVPAPNEIIIQYGEYPHTVSCLPVYGSQIVYRHPIYFNLVQHDIVEYDESFEKIDKIYILNLIDRPDRLWLLLVELCKIRAPLHRICYYGAKKEPHIGVYASATKNHLDVVDDFIQSTTCENALIIEDDITFVSDITRIWKQLKLLFERSYSYDICFLAYSKYGEIVDVDDLVSQSKQYCTTSSCYLIQRNTVEAVRDCLKVGYEEMKNGGNPNIYYCDRYWTKLNTLLVLRDKIAYQRISFSNITSAINYNFD
jgi:hypothetical protein